MILRILLIAKNMVCNLLKKVTSRLFRRPSHPATALPVYITQGSTAFKRGFVTVVDKNKLYHVANYGALYKTDLLVKNLNHYGKFCKRCGQMLDARFPLSSPSPNNIVVCLGCIRLFGPFKDFDCRLEIKYRLLNCNIKPGYLFTTYAFDDLLFHRRNETYTSVLIQDQDYYSVVDFENDEEHIRRSFRAHQSMKTRIKKQNIEVGLKKIRLRELATSLELFELMRKSKGVCAVSGIRGSWTKSSNNPFFLTFDHINPISLGGHFSIDNVQILSHCLNQVKGNESNLELIRWLWCFQNSLKKRMNEVGLNGD